MMVNRQPERCHAPTLKPTDDVVSSVQAAEATEGQQNARTMREQGDFVLPPRKISFMMSSDARTQPLRLQEDAMNGVVQPQTN